MGYGDMANGYINLEMGSTQKLFGNGKLPKF